MEEAEKESLAEERKEKLKSFFRKNNYVLTFSIIAGIALFFWLLALFKLSVFIPSYGWFYLIVLSFCSALLAYYEKFKWMYIPLLIWLIWLAFFIRTGNVANLKDATTNDYTLGPDLDPFLFLRYAKIIDSKGSLPLIDYLRYVPRGYPTAEETKLLPYMIDYFHKIISPITAKSINYSAVIFPVFMFLLTVIAFFLFIRKVFEENKFRDWIALVSSAFLIVSPSLLARTVAGIPEKESVGFLFLFLALYFFISFWKNEKTKISYILAGLAGISTGLMGLVWGGWIYIFVAVSLFVFVCFIFEQTDKRKFFSYIIWLIFSIGMVLIFSQRFKLQSLILSTSSGMSFVVLFILAIDYIIFNTKIKDIIFISSLRKKLSDKIASIAIAIVAGLVLSTLLFGISFVPHFFSDVTEHLTQPYSDRLSFTVAENRQPYFTEWQSSFGPVVNRVPLIFWLFFIGSIFLFYEFVKNMEKKGRNILLITYIIFLVALIFSRYSPTSVMNGANGISQLVYFGSFILIGIVFAYLYYKYFKENKLDEFKKLNFSYLFLLAYFIPSIIGARSAIRLIMALAPPVAGILGFIFMYSIEKLKGNRSENMKYAVYGIVALVVIASFFSFYQNYKETLGGAKSMVPSVYTFQWQNAMAWVRSSTPSDAVFSHWWDYGYWIQSIGNRATVLDGGNSFAYWDYLMGRHVLTAQNQTEALEFLYTHNSSYLLIDSTDIGKYGAYSRIGSDENYDRYSWIGSFFMNEKSIEEKKNETVFYYQGGVALDEDYKYADNASGKEVFLPSGRTGMGAFVLSQIKNSTEFKQPEIIFVYLEQTYRIPLRYLYYHNKLIDYESGYGGCMYIMPQVIQTTQEGRLNEKGAALFLSERNMRALWVRLYLLGETGNFELAHSEDNAVIKDLKSKNIIPQDQDFVFYNDIMGPIKIWKVNYPAGIKVVPEYLSIVYPDSVRLDTFAG